MKNIRARKMTDNPMEKHKSIDDRMAGLWRCESRANNANRRYLALNQIITKHEVLRCLMVCDFKCFYCGEKLNPYKWNLDHHLPTSRGGKNCFDNLRPCCKECNQIKADLIYSELVKRAHRIVLMYMKHNPDYSFSHMNFTVVDKFQKAS
jgi:5-methylcytosine-specific restriction endonuclease McrA